MTELNRTQHDQIAYERWLRRHQGASASDAGAGSADTSKQATR